MCSVACLLCAASYPPVGILQSRVIGRRHSLRRSMPQINTMCTAPMRVCAVQRRGHCIGCRSGERVARPKGGQGLRRGLFADALFSCVQFTLIIQLMLHMRWDPYSDRNLNAVHCPTPYPTIVCSRSRDPLRALTQSEVAPIGSSSARGRGREPQTRLGSSSAVGHHNGHSGGARTHSRQPCIGAVRHGTLSTPLMREGPVTAIHMCASRVTCVCKALRHEPMGSQYVVTEHRRDVTVPPSTHGTVVSKHAAVVRARRRHGL